MDSNKTYMSQFIEKNKDIVEIQNEKCRNCKIMSHCAARGCFACSLYENNTIHIPSGFSCWYSKMRYEIVEKNVQQIEDIQKHSIFGL